VLVLSREKEQGYSAAPPMTILQTLHCNCVLCWLNVRQHLIEQGIWRVMRLMATVGTACSSFTAKPATLLLLLVL
jgi:hypothetical protein